ncbi:hypothetical protein Tco_1035611, partial [Tanacetum coccineum]
SYIPYRDKRLSISEEALGAFGRSQTYSAKDTDMGQRKGYFQNLCSKLVASRGKEVNMAAGDSDDALVCCVKNAVEDRIMDSGASFHATYCKKELERFKLCSSKNLKDVRYIPGLERRLISVGQLDEEGYHVGFGDHQWKVTKGSLVVGRGNKRGSLYMVEVDIYFCKPGFYNISEDKETAETASGFTVAAQMKCDTAFRIRRVTRLSEAEILHLWTRFMEPDNDSIVTEHGLSSEITQSPGGSSDTSKGSKNSGSFEDSGRPNEEYFKD